jgi:hypothetical protein
MAENDCWGLCSTETGSLYESCIGADADTAETCEIAGGYWSQLGYDVCGDCGGDNSTCSDCFGVPYGGASLDDCGVCEGGNICNGEMTDMDGDGFGETCSSGGWSGPYFDCAGTCNDGINGWFNVCIGAEEASGTSQSNSDQ